MKERCPAEDAPFAATDSPNAAQNKVERCAQEATRARKQAGLLSEADKATDEGRDALAYLDALEKRLPEWKTSAASHAPPKKEPVTAQEYKWQARQLPAYEAEPADASGGKTYETCGFLIYTVTEDWIGGKWTNRRLGFNLNRSVVKVAPCKFPASGAKWAAVVKDAQSRLPREYPMKAGDAIVIDARDWLTHKNKLTGVLEAREVDVYHYSRTHKAAAGVCGSPDERLVCEASSPDGGIVRHVNEIRFRLRQAAEYQAKGDAVSCRVAAWAASNAVRGKTWEVGTRYDELTYRTRWDGTLSRADLKARYPTMAQDAETLFGACGGSGPVPAL